MRAKDYSGGFSAVVAVVVVLVVAVVVTGGWYVMNNKDKNASTNSTQPSSSQTQSDDTATWTSVTTQNGAFKMRVPDGWSLVNYPKDFLGSTSVIYRPGVAATIENSDSEYVGHLLRFRASVGEQNDSGLGPQWPSPQPGLNESTQDFYIGSLKGKRFKGIFSGDINQTLYEYVFDLGSNKRLDIVYTVYNDKNEKDDFTTVEKAIKTIELKE